MQKQIFHYLTSFKNLKKYKEGDLIVITMSAMPELYSRCVHIQGKQAFAGLDILHYNPLYGFKVKSVKINNNDHIPGF